MRSIGWSVLGVVALAQVACSKGSEKASQPAPGPNSSPALQEFNVAQMEHSRNSLLSSAPLQAEATAPFDVQHYRLEGRFDWETHRMVATQTITLLVQDSKASQIEFNAGKDIEAFTRVQWNGKSANYTRKGDILIVTLPPADELEKGKKHQLVLDYSVDAVQSGNLHHVGARVGDPVGAKVFYTTSEPQGARNWMPCLDAPHDRATFEVHWVLPASENFVANGASLYNKVEGNWRKVGYQIQNPIPTYLMAFAGGEMESVTRIRDGKPLELWYRRGLDVDTKGVLDRLDTMMSTTESLLLPYPFEKYALVMLPEFPAGGIEHASVTFQAETRSSLGNSAADNGLSAHELAHQWFGDFATVESWDDLWIKEGMATLIAAEVSRKFDSPISGASLMGPSFFVNPADAIVDPSLKPGEKYTSGPYARSAWWFTQVRSVVGESDFWGTMASLLKQNAFGTLNREKVLTAFKEKLDKETFLKMEKSLFLKGVPKVVVAQGEDESLKISLEDPSELVFSPVQVSSLSETEISTFNLTQGNVTLNAKLNPLVSINDLGNQTQSLEIEVKPEAASAWQKTQIMGQSHKWEKVNLFSPFNQIQFVSKTLKSDLKLVSLAPTIQKALDLSPSANMSLWRAEWACAQWLQEPSAGTQKTMVQQLAVVDPNGLSRSFEFESCSAALQKEGLPGVAWQLDALRQNPSRLAQMSQDSLRILRAFSLPASRSFEVWSPVVMSAGSHRMKLLGLEKLSSHVAEGSKYPVLAGDKNRWLTFFAGLEARLQTKEAKRSIESALKALSAETNHNQ